MISVCIATYNGDKYIKKQLNSILCQLSENDEVIISDDGSTDSTLDIIDSYNDKRIKLFRHQKNTRFSKIQKSRSFYYATQNFENSLIHAKGDYIFLSDQDDIWKEDKVSKVIEQLQNFDIVMTNFSLIDEKDEITLEKFYESSPISSNLLINILRARFLGCCMAFNRNVLNYVLPFPTKLIGHDYWIGCLGVSRFRFLFIEDSLHLYRRTNSNVSSASGKSSNSFIYKIMYRLVFLLQCIKRIMVNSIHSTSLE